MNPAFIWYWKNHLRHDPCGGFAYASCGPDLGAHFSRRSTRSAEFAGRSRSDDDAVFGSAGFGVRRPLRFLAMRLDLDEEQVDEVSRILETLKIERAQAAVDLRRTASDLADAFEESEFAADRVQAARERRVETAGRVQDAVSRALGALHTVLDQHQRERLASLIRRGELRI